MMPTKKVTISLTEEQLSALQSSFARPGDSAPLTEKDLATTLTLAAASWVDLLSGRKRYRSLTEQYIDWLADIYSTVLTDEEPNETRLFSHFSFPYGQALYLARVLREQQQGVWRRKALTALREILNARLAEADAWTKEGRGEEKMNFTISKGSRVELSNILGLLVEQRVPGLSPVRTEGTMGSYASVSITAANIKSLIKAIDKTIESMS